MRLHHIGLACEDIEKTRLLWEHLFDTTYTPVKKVESQDVLVSFYNLGACRIELVQAASSQSPRFPIMPHPVIAFIEKQDEGMHHISLEKTLHLQNEIKRLKAQGIRTISPQLEIGAEGPVVFLNPGDCGGTLVEICEVPSDDIG